MDIQEFIPLDVFCRHHGIAVAFMVTLHEFSLIEVVEDNSEKYIPISQLPEVEKIIRLHNDLAINTEGVDVVLHLLQKIKTMQQEMALLKSKLRLYE